MGGQVYDRNTIENMVGQDGQGFPGQPQFADTTQHHLLAAAQLSLEALSAHARHPACLPSTRAALPLFPHQAEARSHADKGVNRLS